MQCQRLSWTCSWVVWKCTHPSLERQICALGKRSTLDVEYSCSGVRMTWVTSSGATPIDASWVIRRQPSSRRIRARSPSTVAQWSFISERSSAGPVLTRAQTPSPRITAIWKSSRNHSSQPESHSSSGPGMSPSPTFSICTPYGPLMAPRARG